MQATWACFGGFPVPLVISVVWAVQLHEGCYEGFDETVGQPQIIVGNPSQ